MPFVADHYGERITQTVGELFRVVQRDSKAGGLGGEQRGVDRQSDGPATGRGQGLPHRHRSVPHHPGEIRGDGRLARGFAHHVGVPQFVKQSSQF